MPDPTLREMLRGEIREVVRAAAASNPVHDVSGDDDCLPECSGCALREALAALRKAAGE